MSVAVTAEGRPLASEVIVGGGDSRTDLLTLNVWKAADPLFFIGGTLVVKVDFWDATLAAAPFLNVVIAFVIL